MYSKLIICGNLGADPELRYTPAGQPVTHLRVATNRQWTDNRNQVQKETTWFRVSVWGKQAESANQYLQKGSKVLVEGRLVPDPKTGGPRVWQGRDGSANASFEVSADTVRYLSSRNEQAGGHSATDKPSLDEDAWDDVPF